MVDNPDAEPEGDGGNPPEGGAGTPDGKQEPSPKDGGEDLTKLKEQYENLKTLFEKQQDVLKKFQTLGQEPPPTKTDAERIAELEATLNVVTKKLETDKQAQDEAARKKREAIVEGIIKDQPAFKDQRESLLKADENILNLISKQKRETPSPVVRSGAGDSNEWAKKIAAATERRKKRTETLNTIKF